LLCDVGEFMGQQALAIGRPGGELSRTKHDVIADGEGASVHGVRGDVRGSIVVDANAAERAVEVLLHPLPDRDVEGSPRHRQCHSDGYRSCGRGGCCCPRARRLAKQQRGASGMY
jgi:hypothetical protein